MPAPSSSSPDSSPRINQSGLNLRSAIKKWLKYATGLLMIIQLIDFIVVIHEFFEIKLVEWAEPLGIFISLFLTLWVFKRFLIREFGMSDFDSYVLIFMFLLFNLSFLLRFLVEEELLHGMSYVLNYIPILVLAVLPLYLLARGDSKKYVEIMVFTVIVVFPLSQLYTMVLKKFVAIAVTVYVLYIFVQMLKEKDNRIKEAFQKLIEFDEVAVRQIHGLGAKNKEFYYVYFLIWLFIISDVVLFLPPKFFGLWGHTHYHEILGIESHEIEITSAFMASSLSFIVITSYPLLSGLFKKSYVLAPLFVLFLAYPTIVMSPLTEEGVYGTVLDVKELVDVPLVDTLAPVLTFIAVIFILFIFKVPFVYELRIFLRSVVIGVSSAYILVFLMSLFTGSATIDILSPNIVLVVLLMGFFLFALIFLPYNTLLEVRKTRLKFSVEILFLLIFTMFFSYMPSIYSTLSLISYSAFFILGTLRFERILIIAYLISLMFETYLIILASAFLVYGIYTSVPFLRNTVEKESLKIFLLIPIFVALSLIVKEKIPFEYTYVGLASLAILSGSEEVIFKKFMYDKMRKRLREVSVPIAFSLVHILGMNSLNYYIGTWTLPIYLIYLFAYQYITIRLYEENKNLIPFITAHALINIFALSMTIWIGK